LAGAWTGGAVDILAGGAAGLGTNHRLIEEATELLNANLTRSAIQRPRRKWDKRPFEEPDSGAVHFRSKSQ
jgi:hypothetical protein